MPSRAVKELLGNPVDAYLAQCRVRNPLVENEESTHVPPSPSEAHELFSYLEKKGIDAVVIGSVGVLHYVRDPKGFRPTVDLDLFVNRSHAELSRLSPPPGWHRDLESPGVVSWISPSGGYVDFVTANHEFPGGEKTLGHVAVNRQAELNRGYPIARSHELFLLKLNSVRPKDLTDCMNLAQAVGLPTEAELIGANGGHKLNVVQQENLALLRQWMASRSKGVA